MCTLLVRVALAQVSSFTEVAEVIFGENVAQLGDLFKNNETAFNQVIQRAFFKDFMWTVRTRSIPAFYGHM